MRSRYSTPHSKVDVQNDCTGGRPEQHVWQLDDPSSKRKVDINSNSREVNGLFHFWPTGRVTVDSQEISVRVYNYADRFVSPRAAFAFFDFVCLVTSSFPATLSPEFRRDVTSWYE